MTLKDKFRQWFVNDEEDEHYEGMVDLVSIEHEKIADDFAIGFAEWLIKRPRYSNKESLEIYKKEKGL
jgi:hypothetical protein